MPHLRFEYSNGLEKLADLDGLAAALRTALVDTGQCPLGGIRVRGFRADHQAIADSAETYHFLDMVLRLGAGRKDAIRAEIADQVYTVAEANLRPQVGDTPFILSFEIAEIDSLTSRKSWSTIHAAIKERGA